jgi:hypothetical protein
LPEQEIKQEKQEEGHSAKNRKKHQLVSTITTLPIHHGCCDGYDNKSQALHFLKIAKKAPGIPSPYEKRFEDQFVGLVYTKW